MAAQVISSRFAQSPTKNQLAPQAKAQKTRILHSWIWILQALCVSFCYNEGMADSINKFKSQQNTYLREIKQEKAERKRELASQKQQDLLDLRQFYKEEERKLDEDSADAVNHIRSETRDVVRHYMDDRREEKEEIRLQQNEERQARIEELRAYSGETSSNVYDRRGKKKALLQKAEPNKSSDAFYKVQNRGSSVVEKKHNYIIEAYAPQHEKDNIQVSVHRDKAVISGKRKFGDSVEDGNKKISTSNFQTFREEFKFNRPVSADGITRERSGDYVRFIIPKEKT